MKLRQILSTGIMLAGLAGLLGCEVVKKPKPVEPQTKDFFMELSVYAVGIGSASDDFDNDGDKDVMVISSEHIGKNFYSMRFRILENDGKGNFTLKQYPVNKPEVEKEKEFKQY